MEMNANPNLSIAELETKTKEELMEMAKEKGIALSITLSMQVFMIFPTIKFSCAFLSVSMSRLRIQSLCGV